MSNRNILILVGAPAAGKTTYCKNLLSTEDNWFRVSRDEIRFSQFKEILDRRGEDLINLIVEYQIQTALEYGWNVVVDACHCNQKYIETLTKRFEEEQTTIELKILDVPLEELLLRNSKRDRKVPEEVIKRFYNQLQSWI